MKKEYKKPLLVVENFAVSDSVAAKCAFTVNTTFSSQMKHSGNKTCHNGEESIFNDGPAADKIGFGTKRDPEYFHWNIINQAFEGSDIDVDGDGQFEGRCFTKEFASKYGEGVCQDLTAENMAFAKTAQDSFGVTISPCTQGEGTDGVNPLQNS